MLKTIKTHYEFLLLTLLAFSVRLINLSKLNLWLDEGATAEDVHRGLEFIFKDSFKAEPNPPAYNTFLFFWTKIFGDSEYALRLPSAFFGAACVGLIYLIGKKVSSRITGLIAGVLVFGNPFYLFYSQESRAYSLFAFISLLVVYYFPYDLYWENKKKFTAALFLLPWVHAYGVFLLLASNVYVLLAYYRFEVHEQKKIFIKSWMRIQSVVVGLASIWYLTFLFNKESYFKRVQWIKIKEFTDIFVWIKSYIFASDKIAFAFIIISLLCCLYFFIKKQHTKNRNLILIGLWVLFTLALPFLAQSFWPSLLEKRYTVAASMGLLVLLIVPLERLISKSQALTYFVLMMVSALSSRQIVEYFKAAKKEEWVEIIDYIKSVKASRDAVVLDANYERSSFDYYLRKKGLQDQIKPIYVENASEVQDLVKIHPSVWFVRIGEINPEGINKDMLNINDSFSPRDNELQIVKINKLKTP